MVTAEQTREVIIKRQLVPRGHSISSNIVKHENVSYEIVGGI